MTARELISVGEAYCIDKGIATVGGGGQSVYLFFADS